MMRVTLIRGSIYVAGLFCAAFVGYLIGRGSIATPSPSTSAKTTLKTSREAQGNDNANIANGPVGNRPSWSQRVAEIYAQAEPGTPTPGFATLFKEAIDRGEPFYQGCTQMLLEGMRAEDLPQAFALMKRATEGGKFRGAPGWGQQSIVWGAFWHRFGQLDPANALNEVRNLGEIDYFGKDMAEKDIFRGWTIRNPEEAAKGYLARKDLLQPGFAVQGISYEWAMVDRQAATRWVNENLSGEIREHALFSMTYAVINGGNFQQGVDWLLQLPDEGSRKRAFTSLQDIANRGGPGITTEDRLAMVTAGLTIGVRDEGMENNIANRMATTDPSSTAELFTKFPSPTQPGRYNAVGITVGIWANKDPQAAGQWLQKQQGEPWYNSAAASLAATLASRDRAAAESWAATISDEGLRQEAMAAIARPRPTQPKR